MEFKLKQIRIYSLLSFSLEYIFKDLLNEVGQCLNDLKDFVDKLL